MYVSMYSAKRASSSFTEVEHPTSNLPVRQRAEESLDHVQPG